MVNLKDEWRRFRTSLGARSKRNLWSTFGYPEQILPAEYLRRYKRDGIARRVVRAYPDACWSDSPQIRDGEGSSSDKSDATHSEFSQAWERLAEDLGVFRYLSRVDRLARVGHYAILVLGFDDAISTADLKKPLHGTANLVYLSAYGETSAKITKFDENPSSPRYGLPSIYTVTQGQGSAGEHLGGRSSFEIHHSRVIHVTEGNDESEVFGEPALRAIWNDLLDLEKVKGSGAETFWLNARGGLSIEVDATADLTQEARAAMREQMDDFENELRRSLALQGATAKPLVMNVSDPTPNATLLHQSISGTTGIPTRILLGSEQGQLASSEDANSWEARVDERRKDHCGPSILVPFVDRMIETGNLPEPVIEWMAEWPEAAAMSPEKQADIAVKRITAASTWAQGFADRIVAPEEVRVWLGLPVHSEYDLAGEDLPGDDLGDGEEDPDYDEDPDQV